MCADEVIAKKELRLIDKERAVPRRSTENIAYPRLHFR